MDKIINLETRHFRNASNYIFDCPIEIALREENKDADICVGPENVRIDGQHYFIKGSEGDQAYAGLTPDDIDDLILKAKAGEEIETITVTLIPTDNDYAW